MTCHARHTEKVKHVSLAHTKTLGNKLPTHMILVNHSVQVMFRPVNSLDERMKHKPNHIKGKL